MSYDRVPDFAPKASYFGADPQKGMDALVNAIHKAGMEIFLEFSFTSEKIIENPRFIAGSDRHIIIRAYECLWHVPPVF